MSEKIDGQEKIGFTIPVQKRDIPTENVFMVGIIAAVTTRDAFHINQPRDPFVISRPEALNLIGYFITQADLCTQDIEQAVRQRDSFGNLYGIVGDERRVCIRLPKLHGVTDFSGKETSCACERPSRHKVWRPLVLITMNEALNLIACLICEMKLRPSEIDAAIMAIWEAPRGQETEAAMLLKPLLIFSCLGIRRPSSRQR